MKSGFVSIIGVPNAGKSTLMNRVLGTKVSIATSKPQTTRNRIIGIHSEDRGQIAFVDTPGVHKPTKALNHFMVDVALKSLEGTDIVLFVVDATRDGQDGGLHAGDAFIIEELAKAGVPTIVALNKIDRIKEKDALLTRIGLLSTVDDWKPEAVLPVSALEGDGLDGLLSDLFARLPEGPPLYPTDMVTDQAERFLASEIIREKLVLQTRRELPYSTAVMVEEFRDDNRRGLLKIRALVCVERDSQKGIVIGKGGSRLKQVGSQARAELEKFFAKKVYLDLHVKVEKNWSENRNMLKQLGYEADDN